MIRVQRFLVVTAFLALTACGAETDFAGSNGKRGGEDAVVKDDSEAPGTETPAEPPIENPIPTDTPYAALTWFWECDSTPGGAPTAKNDEEVVLKGTGPHAFYPGQLKGTPITFSGKLCQPAAVPRDILFVIDVSGSMQDNDPRIGNSCGRLAAIQQVIASLVGTDARYGLVAFSSTAVNSPSYYQTEAELFTAMGAPINSADVACAFISGTNYDAALSSAQLLLPQGRAGATKEIYFVSDGQPDFGSEGIARASTMKATGVTIGADTMPLTIATIMLGGTDTVLENSIASRDSGGKALHAYVAQTGDLAQVLTGLTANSIEGGDLSYRAIGSSNWTKLDLMSHLQGFDFTLPSISIDSDGAPEGLEVKYEYFDKRGNRFESGGKLVWKVAEG
jgi:hypothetical protein